MSGKTIFVINQFAGTPTSGWGERHYYFAKYWIEAGYQVNIISATYNHMFKEVKDTDQRFLVENHEGRRFCWIKTPVYNAQNVSRFWSMFVFAWRVLSLPVKTLGKPDVIIVSSMPIFPIVTASWLRRKFKGTKLIFEIRDLWPETPIHLGGYSRNHPFILLLAWFERFGFRKSDHIVSLLPNAAGYINPISKAPEKFNYIPNGLSLELLTDLPLPTEVQAQLPSNKFVIGYAGTIGLANALEYFVDAAKLLRHDNRFHFVIVGDGYLKPELEKRAEGLNNVTFVPKIRKDQVQAMLRHFDICFVGRNDSPLFQHGVSANKYFDYMLASKPILDSNMKIKDPVELSDCGIIVKPNSAEAIAAGVVSLFEMGPETRASMGLKGYEYVTQFHDIKHLAEKYARLFGN